MSVLTVARDQLADLRRRRFVLALLIAGVLLTVGFCLYLAMMEKLLAATIGAQGEIPGEMTEQEQIEFRNAMEIGTAAMQTGLYVLVSFVGSILSLVMFCSLVSSERARGSLPWVMAKPVTREQFLLGKWLGACVILVIYTALMSAILLGYSRYAEGHISRALGYTCVLMLFKFALMGSVGMMLSMVMPPVLGGLLAYFAGAELFHGIAQLLAPSRWLEGICTVIYYVLPSYGQFNAYTQFLIGIEMEPKRVLLLAAYALVYSAVMLWLAQLALRRHDLA